MPRLPPTLIRTAYKVDPLLAHLIPECRTLSSARNELRWMREHLHKKNESSPSNQNLELQLKLRLKRMVNERARGKPLQYILGDQPFGGLDILCRPGVLIPRPETESYTTRIANWVLTNYTSKHARNNNTAAKALRILDLCTGTGCIPLLLHALLAPSIPYLRIVGVDISPTALRLARQNLTHNLENGNLLPRAETEVSFVSGDVLRPQSGSQKEKLAQTQDTLGNGSLATQDWDIVISNPPYISPRAYRDGTTRRSVRLYEPELALVPPLQDPYSSSTSTTRTASSARAGNKEDNDEHARQDSFYAPLLSLSARVRARLTVLECGDVEQARRVVCLASTQRDHSDLGSDRRVETRVGIWRCDRDEGPADTNGRIGDEDGDGDEDDGGARAVVLVRE